MRHKHKKLNNGMTVIELMTAVVIIGILVAIGVANYFTSSKKRALEASLISNMRTLQIMLETYKVDWQVYPKNITELSLEATNKNYNKSVTNPYTSQTGTVGSSNIWAIDAIDPTDSNFPSLKDNYKGRVGYTLAKDNLGQFNTGKYYLMGYDGNSELVIRNNKTYLVTNGDLIQ